MATYDAQPDPGATTQIAVDPGLVTWTHVMYALHALAVLIGVLGAASVIGSFLFGLPSIAAVVMNYLRRGDVRGTWLESHFRWQLRTFWFAFLWVALSLLAFGWLVLILVGIPLLIGAFALISLWVGYRVVRGWLALKDSRAIP